MLSEAGLAPGLSSGTGCPGAHGSFWLAWLLAEGAEIVFGVSRPEDIDSDVFSNDENCRERWVKSEKNALIYGNAKTNKMAGFISTALVICLYGCSMGKSGSYIWHEVGKRLRGNGRVMAVLFVRGLPD